MKKDRDCSSTMYPVYPMPYMTPNMMPMGMGMTMSMNNIPNSNNGFNSIDNSTLANQINALEKRVSNLEAMVSNNSYNNNSYQMM
ncbi:MAG: hypothetical protein IJ565_04355 [Bacilli bacterium]|nr:hypothetical protein [Bacilli bacterium]